MLKQRPSTARNKRKNNNKKEQSFWKKKDLSHEAAVRSKWNDVCVINIFLLPLQNTYSPTSFSAYGFLYGLHHWVLLPFCFQLDWVHGKHAKCWRVGQEGTHLPGILPERNQYASPALCLKATAPWGSGNHIVLVPLSCLGLAMCLGLPVFLGFRYYTHTILWGFLKLCPCL